MKASDLLKDPNSLIFGGIMDNSAVKFHLVLRDHLEKSHLTQVEFAKKLSVSQSTFHAYLYGVLPRGLMSAIKIAQDLEIGLDQLVFGEKQSFPQ